MSWVGAARPDGAPLFHHTLTIAYLRFPKVSCRGERVPFGDEPDHVQRIGGKQIAMRLSNGDLARDAWPGLPATLLARITPDLCGGPHQHDPPKP
jgi:hypothetical protein